VTTDETGFDRNGQEATAAVVGMVGGGPLAHLTHRAAVDLGVRLEVMASASGEPAQLAGAPHQAGPTDRPELLGAFARRCSVITVDNDDTPLAWLEALEAEGCTLRPRVEAIGLTRDKAELRRTLEEAGFAVAPHACVDLGDVGAVAAFAEQWGWPIVATRRDGSGSQIVEDLAAARALPGSGPTEGWILDSYLPEATRLIVLLARNPSGFTVTYPVVERQHGSARSEWLMPARISDEVEAAATGIAKAIADGIDATGTLAVQLLLSGDGLPIVDGIDARPHPSGSMTVDACATSQFENHLRGILDWPLGSTAMLAPVAASIEVFAPQFRGDALERVAAALSVPRASLRLSPGAPRAERRLGHVIALGADHDQALNAARMAAHLLADPLNGA
jgi:5-(carboxyamino)imidazole ribonucleotide synthase